MPKSGGFGGKDERKVLAKLGHRDRGSEEEAYCFLGITGTLFHPIEVQNELTTNRHKQCTIYFIDIYSSSESSKTARISEYLNIGGGGGGGVANAGSDAACICSDVFFGGGDNCC